MSLHDRSSDVLKSYVTSLRSIARRLSKICAENENYKVKSAAADAISCFIRRGENLLDSLRHDSCSLLTSYLKEELKSGVLVSRLLSSLRTLLRNLVVLKIEMMDKAMILVEVAAAEDTHSRGEVVSPGSLTLC